MALAFLFDLDLSQSLSRQRVFRDRLNPIDVYNDTEFIPRYRVTKYKFVQLQEKVVTFLIDQLFDHIPQLLYNYSQVLLL